MKVFVATETTQGRHCTDEMNCVEGELVWMIDPCPLSRRFPDGPCACGRTFRGMFSDGFTTTALVRDLDLTRDDYKDALCASHDNRPDCTCPFDPDAMIEDLLRAAERFPVGAVVARRVNRIVMRAVVAT